MQVNCICYFFQGSFIDNVKSNLNLIKISFYVFPYYKALAPHPPHGTDKFKFYHLHQFTSTCHALEACTVISRNNYQKGYLTQYQIELTQSLETKPTVSQVIKMKDFTA